MKTIKFRYTDAQGKQCYKKIPLPDDAALFVGKDWEGNDIFEGDKLIASMNHKKKGTALLQPMLKYEEWSKHEFTSDVEYSHMVSIDKRAKAETSRWCGKSLTNNDEIYGVLDFRRNDANLDRYDCYLVDAEGPHLVGISTLRRVER